MAKNISLTEIFVIISGSQIEICGTVRLGILDFTCVMPLGFAGEAKVFLLTFGFCWRIPDVRKAIEWTIERYINLQILLLW